MFSRATKLIVRSLGPRHFYIGEQNFKNAFTGGAGEISRTLSQMLRSSKKLNVVALYNLAAVNKLSNHNRIHDYCSNQSIGLTPSKVDGSSILHFYKHEADNGKHETEKLTEALYNLPIAEGAPTLNSSLMSNAAMPKLRPKVESPSGRFREHETIGEDVHRAKYGRVDALPKSPLETSVGTTEECLGSEIGYSVRSAFGIGKSGLLGWNRHPLTSSLDGLARARNFSSFHDAPTDAFLTNEASARSGQEARECFPKRSAALNCQRSFGIPLTEMPINEVLAPTQASTCPASWRRTFPLAQSYVPAPSSSYESADFKRPRTIPRSRRKDLRSEIFSGIPRGTRYSTPLRRAHWRGFHSTATPLGKSGSDEPTGCQKMGDICKTETNDCGKCSKKKDPCRRERVKCVEPQRPKEAPPEKSQCWDSCLPKNKCDIIKSEPPLKMTYKKLECPPPKFARLASCPAVQADTKRTVQSAGGFDLIKKKKKRLCPPKPLPKPPCVPIFLCACPPPLKVHPGSCPCYEYKSEPKSFVVSPCPPKKPYPCPKGRHYCPPQKCKMRCEKDQSNGSNRSKSS